MQHISSTEARNNLSKVIDLAQREPLVVQKQGRDVAVILSAQDFARITQDNIESFIAFSEMVGHKAMSKGLTDATLNQLLNE